MTNLDHVYLNDLRADTLLPFDKRRYLSSAQILTLIEAAQEGLYLREAVTEFLGEPISFGSLRRLHQVHSPQKAAVAP